MNVYLVTLDDGLHMWVVAKTWDDVYSLVPSGSDVVATRNYSLGDPVRVQSEVPTI